MAAAEKEARAPLPHQLPSHQLNRKDQGQAAPPAKAPLTAGVLGAARSGSAIRPGLWNKTFREQCTRRKFAEDLQYFPCLKLYAFQKRNYLSSGELLN